MAGESRSSRARGLKSSNIENDSPWDFVALFTSAWIEIRNFVGRFSYEEVALFTSAWIEMPEEWAEMYLRKESRSSRARGLKYLILRPRRKLYPRRALHERVD